MCFEGKPIVKGDLVTVSLTRGMPRFHGSQ